MPLSQFPSSLLDDRRSALNLRSFLSLIRQHQLIVALLLFASFLFLFIQLPWSLDSHEVAASTLSAAALLCPTFLRGHGTMVCSNMVNDSTTVVPSGSDTPRVAKITILSGFEDVLYERALQTHINHAAYHGYPLYMGREEAAPGMFNKIAFIMNVLLNELYKPAENRVEWLFYFDADSIIMNEKVPLEIFEPPSDFRDINWLAGRDYNGLNAGVFLLRVHPWSLNLLSRVMTHKHYHPNEDYTFEEQSILARLTENDEEFSKQSLYVPRSWFNAYFYMQHEAQPGLLLSHFPHPDYKWHMYEWLKILEDEAVYEKTGKRPGKDENPDAPYIDQNSTSVKSEDDEEIKIYNVPVQSTVYPEEIRRFWAVKRRADKALRGFQRNVDRGADPIAYGLERESVRPLAEDFQEKLQHLRKDLKFKTENPEELEQMVNDAEEANAKLISALMAYFETHEDDRPPQAGF